MFAESQNYEGWRLSMPGVSICTCSGSGLTGDLPLAMERAHSEAFFCTGGRMTITRRSGVQEVIEAREILLLSDCSDLQQVTVDSPLEGIMIHVEQIAAGETFRNLCAQFHLPLSMKRVGEFMKEHQGLRVVPVTPWSRAVFYALKRLPEEERTNYCILKTFELLYLFCNQEKETAPSQRDQIGSTAAIAQSMKAYMESHLDEKLTISDLSHRFHLSRTACKSAFRSCVDQPIHSWLLDRRMERAAELLEKTKMPILQVAQSVGYTGVSQFNVAFRQRYGKSPREYRKMSVSVAF